MIFKKKSDITRAEQCVQNNYPRLRGRNIKRNEAINENNCYFSFKRSPKY